jgi:DNA-binding MarR family transcriptional regulator
MTDAPTLTGQDIGTAARATGAVLDRLLSATGTDFQSWVVLNQVGSNSPAIDRDQLVARVVSGLKVDAASVSASLAGLVHSGLVSEVDGSVSLTPTGTERFDGIRESIGGITRRIYGGLPADELAVAHRVLATVTERANAELAA